ncbi:thioredoxin reductase [Micromonospora sp. ATCC 39149]|nr:thioredoxin reductase [Micromonospora sp. ATCC 39149]
MTDRALDNDKIHLAWNSVVEEILGHDDAVARARLRDIHTGQTRVLDVTGVSAAIGHNPRSELFRAATACRSAVTRAAAISSDDNAASSAPRSVLHPAPTSSVPPLPMIGGFTPPTAARSKLANLRRTWICPAFFTACSAARLAVASGESVSDSWTRCYRTTGSTPGTHQRARRMEVSSVVLSFATA